MSELDPDVRRWVDLLGVVGQHLDAYAALEGLAVDVRRRAAVSGLMHRDWRVRRSCARLLDDVDFTPEAIDALTAALADEHPKVRRAALHTLSCANCKPSGCAFDPRPLYERMAGDPSRGVREQVVGSLTWDGVDDWSERMLRQFVEDPSPTLRELARRGLERIRAMRDLDDRRRRLAPEVVAATERHAGKWVAVAHGRVVDAAAMRGRVARAARAVGADVYWVAP